MPVGLLSHMHSYHTCTAVASACLALGVPRGALRDKVTWRLTRTLTVLGEGGLVASIVAGEAGRGPNGVGGEAEGWEECRELTRYT
jgi:hypothetical protein